MNPINLYSPWSPIYKTKKYCRKKAGLSSSSPTSDCCEDAKVQILMKFPFTSNNIPNVFNGKKILEFRVKLVLKQHLSTHVNILAVHYSNPFVISSHSSKMKKDDLPARKIKRRRS
jgi:hypothetical protein